MSNANEAKNWIRGELEQTEYWRGVKAEEHPEDNRNMKAQSECVRLLQSLDDVKLDYLFEKIFDIWTNEKSKYVLLHLQEEQSQFFRSIGFHGDHNNTKEMLEGYISQCEHIFQENL